MFLFSPDEIAEERLDEREALRAYELKDTDKLEMILVKLGMGSLLSLLVEKQNEIRRI